MFEFKSNYFFIALLIGFMLVYIFYEPKIILKEPNPDDPTSNLYVDNRGVCYRYNREPVRCPLAISDKFNK
jgi:hypothetical protein